MLAQNKARGQDGVDTDFRKIPKLPQHMEKSRDRKSQHTWPRMLQENAGTAGSSRQKVLEAVPSLQGVVREAKMRAAVTVVSLVLWRVMTTRDVEHTHDPLLGFRQPPKFPERTRCQAKTSEQAAAA